MRLPLAVIVLFSLASCSRDNPATSAKPASPRLSDRFSVTFAVVKLQNDDLLARGCLMRSTNGLAVNLQESREYAAYILDHKSDFAFAEARGNTIPLVTATHQQTNARLDPDAGKEDRDFEKFGFKTEKFEASLDVRDEDDRGDVTCNSLASYLISMKEHEGGSFEHGGSGSFIGPVIKVGEPEMGLLEIVKGNSLWALYKLDKE